MKVLAGISPIVFHSTSLNKLRNILKGNVFYFTPKVKSAETLIGDEYKYFFSTARNKASHYLLGSKCIITLDGLKLMQNMKGKAIDYWGEDYRKHRKGDYEQEDRIFSNKPRLENANKYIKQIDILVDTMPRDLFTSIMLNAKRLKVPVYFYGDVQSFRLGAKSRALPTKQIIENVKNRKEEYPKISPIDFTKDMGERMVDGYHRHTPAGYTAARMVKTLQYLVEFIHHFEKYATQKNYKVPARIADSKERRYIDSTKLKEEVESIIGYRSELSERLLDKLESIKRMRGLKTWRDLSHYLDDLDQFAQSKDGFYSFLERLKDETFVKSYFRSAGPEKIKEEIEYRKNDVQKAADKMKSKYRLKVEI